MNAARQHMVNFTGQHLNTVRTHQSGAAIDNRGECPAPQCSKVASLVPSDADTKARSIVASGGLSGDLLMVLGANVYPIIGGDFRMSMEYPQCSEDLPINERSSNKVTTKRNS
jgi:hypothetical protein